MIGVVPCISVPVGAQSNVNLESVPSLTSDFGVSTNENKMSTSPPLLFGIYYRTLFRVEHHLLI